MKKSICLVLLISLITVSICGCGGEEYESSGDMPAVSDSVSGDGLEEGASSQNDVDDSDDETLDALDQVSSGGNIQTAASAAGIAPDNIKDLFGLHGIKAGTCLSQRMIYDPNYSGLIKEQFNSVTLENAMKPESILNQSASKKAGDIVVELKGETKNLLDWAQDNNMALRGHTLIWHQQTPEWIFHEDFNASKDLVTRDVMLQRMESYISQVFSVLDEAGYLDMIYAYDVVNEAWDDNHQMRDSLWKQVIGDDYLYWAFYYARMYAPDHVDLYYNDYNEQFKNDTVIEWAQGLKDEDGKRLIDGIGLQAHLYTLDDLSRYFNAVDAYAKSGFKISLTELDVCLGAYQNKLPADKPNLEAQGTFYYDLINGLLERKDAGKLNLDSITFWGVTDNQSWRSEQYPLLFDNELNPKPAFDGVMLKKN